MATQLFTCSYYYKQCIYWQFIKLLIFSDFFFIFCKVEKCRQLSINGRRNDAPGLAFIHWHAIKHSGSSLSVFFSSLRWFFLFCSYRLHLSPWLVSISNDFFFYKKLGKKIYMSVKANDTLRQCSVTNMFQSHTILDLWETLNNTSFKPFIWGRTWFWDWLRSHSFLMEELGRESRCFYFQSTLYLLFYIVYAHIRT